MSSLGFFWDVGLMSSTLILMIIYRRRMAKWFMKIPLSRFLLYLLVSLPFMLIEENINCLQSGCKLVPPAIPFLFVFVVLLGLLVKYTPLKNFTLSLFLFAIFGIFIEFTYGEVSSHLSIASWTPFQVFITIWIGLSYVYLVVVPLTILLRQEST